MGAGLYRERKATPPQEKSTVMREGGALVPYAGGVPLVTGEKKGGGTVVRKNSGGKKNGFLRGGGGVTLLVKKRNKNLSNSFL